MGLTAAPPPKGVQSTVEVAALTSTAIVELVCTLERGGTRGGGTRGVGGGSEGEWSRPGEACPGSPV